MARIYFDYATHGFYSSAVNEIPFSAVEIGKATHQELLSGLAAGKRIGQGADGLPVLVDAPIDLPTAEELCGSVDNAADAARARVAGDPLRAVEYDRSRLEAQAFADAGYPADAVPRTVAAWAINGRTAQQAADSILAEAAAYTEALYAIRETRLAAKEQIRALMAIGEIERAREMANAAVAHIDAAVAGIGNN